MIVGHSLGGGAAALMSIFLQSQYPNTCCAFDPPGETLSPRLREESTRFITTTVFGYDIFPRVSSYTFSLLQDNIVSSLCYCKLSKSRFFWLAFANRLDMKSLFYTTFAEMSWEKQDTLSNWLMQVRMREACDVEPGTSRAIREEVLFAGEYYVREVRQALCADEEGKEEDAGEGEGCARGRRRVLGHSAGTSFLV